MSNLQINIKAVFSTSLKNANQNKPFFNKADCMRDFANFHKAKRAVK
jgi:hypothetical protein